jgi:copper(I)-binding protein
MRAVTDYSPSSRAAQLSFKPRKGKLAMLIVFSAVAAACGGGAGRVSVSDAWIRLLPGDLPAAGYFVLHNGTNRELELIGAAAPDFAQVGLHRSTEQKGMQGMAPVTAVQVPAHADIEFKPGGYHLMLMQAERKLAVGGTAHIELRLADGTQIPVDFAIRGPAGTGSR